MLISLSLGFSLPSAFLRKPSAQSERSAFWRDSCILPVSRRINLFNRARRGYGESEFRGKAAAVGGDHEQDFETQPLDRRSALPSCYRLDCLRDAPKTRFGGARSPPRRRGASHSPLRGSSFLRR